MQQGLVRRNITNVIITRERNVMTTLNFKCIAPLVRFSSDIDEIIFDKSIKIRKMTNEEMKIFEIIDSPNGLYFDFKARIAVSQSNYAIFYEFEKEKFVSKDGAHVIDSGLDVAGERIHTFLTFLRLVRKGNISIPIIRVEEIGEGKSGLSGPATQYPEFSLFGDSYFIKSEESILYDSYWKTFLSLLSPVDYSFLIAFSRFGFCYTRILEEDKLIDIMVGLEALLSREHDEATERLANRISWLIGNNDEHRVGIKRIIKKGMYGARSDFIHGRRIENLTNIHGTGFPLKSLIILSQRVLATAIRTSLCLRKSGLSRDGILDLLDECLVSEDARRILAEKKQVNEQFINSESLEFNI